MKKYSVIFFDLDHTIWDFEKNSAETLEELYNEQDLHRRTGESAVEFIRHYKTINFSFWEAYRKGEISKEMLRTGRFRKAFSKYELHEDPVVEFFAEQYVVRSPDKTNLFPNAIDTMDYLMEKYKLIIITNGFEEVQHRKLKACGLTHYFSDVVTSEKAGARKPDAMIYQYAMAVGNTIPSRCIMIGDEPEIDLLGAKNLGIDQVYFNPENDSSSLKVTHEIRDLSELKNFL